MVEYSCQFCGKAVLLMQYGDGWIGRCCNRIVYNDSEPYVAAQYPVRGKEPERDQEEDPGGDRLHGDRPQNSIHRR